MNARNAELISVIARQTRLAQTTGDNLARAMEHDAPLLGRNANAAVMVAGLIENYYTCLETVFQQISQHYENHLDSNRWHADLLSKMVLNIPGVRAAAVSEENYAKLLELQRFRHFRRYYFDLQYDWKRLDYLYQVLQLAHPLAVRDLRAFSQFLADL